MKKLLLLITFLFSIASFGHAQEGYSELKPRKVTFDLTKLSGDFISDYTDNQGYLTKSMPITSDDGLLSLTLHGDKAWRFLETNNIYTILSGSPAFSLEIQGGTLLKVNLKGSNFFYIPDSDEMTTEWTGRHSDILEFKIAKNAEVNQIEVEYILDDDDNRLPINLTFIKEQKKIGINKEIDISQILNIEPKHLGLSNDVESHVLFDCNDKEENYLSLDTHSWTIKTKGKDSNPDNPITIKAFIADDDESYLPVSTSIEISIVNEKRYFTIDFATNGSSKYITDNILLSDIIKEDIDYVKSISAKNVKYGDEKGIQLGDNGQNASITFKFDNDLIEPIDNITILLWNDYYNTEIAINGNKQNIDPVLDLTETVFNFIPEVSSGELTISKDSNQKTIYIKRLTIHFADITEPQKVALELLKSGSIFNYEEGDSYVFNKSDIETKIGVKIKNNGDEQDLNDTPNFDFDNLKINIEPAQTFNFFENINPEWADANYNENAQVTLDDNHSIVIKNIGSSGLYKLSFESMDKNFKLDKDYSVNLNIYPSIDEMTFEDKENEYYYNVSNHEREKYVFTYGSDENNIPHEDWLHDNRKKPVVILPVHGAEIWYMIFVNEGEKDNNSEQTITTLNEVSSVVPAGYKKVAEDNKIDLTRLAESKILDNHKISFILMKNGAATPMDPANEGQSMQTIIFNKENVSTGIDAISADDADAVYFNLQGVKVARPERGIFIRVAGNKAEKVIL